MLKFHSHLHTTPGHLEDLIRVFPHIGFSCYVMSLMTTMMSLYYIEVSNFMFFVPNLGNMPCFTTHIYIGIMKLTRQT